MPDNPLASGRQQAPAHPAMRHAQIWGHVQQQPQDALQESVRTLDYSLPILGKLASNPKTTAKDVIKAVSGAVADGIITPSQGVSTISAIPADRDKLGMWLRERYADALSEAVHSKAALMRGGPQMAPQMAGPQMAAPQMMQGRPPMPGPQMAAPSPSAAPLAPQGVGQ